MATLPFVHVVKVYLVATRTARMYECLSISVCVLLCACILYTAVYTNKCRRHTQRTTPPEWQQTSRDKSAHRKLNTSPQKKKTSRVRPPQRHCMRQMGAVTTWYLPVVFISHKSLAQNIFFVFALSTRQQVLFCFYCLLLLVLWAIFSLRTHSVFGARIACE